MTTRNPATLERERMDEFASLPLTPGGPAPPVPSPLYGAESAEAVRPPLHIGGTPEDHPAPGDLTSLRDVRRLHPLDRPDGATAGDYEAESGRVRLAWAKLLWLLSFLAVLLAISYLVPYIAEETQFAITRGRQRAEHQFARQHLEGSPLAQLSQAYQMVSHAVGPSVVHINTQGGSSSLFVRPMVGSLPHIPSDGQGSGCIIDAAGYILTNYHVIRDAGEIMVSLADGRRVRGEIVGFDRETDLAVLKIDSNKLTAAEWGDSDSLDAGALVWAVGSPFGLERSITSGILSAKHRAGLAGTPYQDFLQTDAAVNPGNSGGPLVNSDGRVVGINTAIVGDAYQGISFAIPSNVAREVFERIKAEGLVRRGWLGVALDAVTDQRASELGLPETTGVFVAEVVSQPENGGSPAAKAGLQAGDVILRFNDVEIDSPAALTTVVGKTSVGSTAKLILFRGGKEVEAVVELGQRPLQLD